MKLNASSGIYRLNIDKIFQTKLLIVRASIGTDAFTFRYVPLKDACLIKQADENRFTYSSDDNKLAKIVAISDTLKVSAENYTETALEITSYDQQLDIILDPV